MLLTLALFNGFPRWGNFLTHTWSSQHHDYLSHSKVIGSQSLVNEMCLSGREVSFFFLVLKIYLLDPKKMLQRVILTLLKMLFSSTNTNMIITIILSNRKMMAEEAEKCGLVSSVFETKVALMTFNMCNFHHQPLSSSSIITNWE